MSSRLPAALRRSPLPRSVRRLLLGIPSAQQHQALLELCDRGLITCTSGAPGEPDATYALAWLALDDPRRYPAEVRCRHTENMRRFSPRWSGECSAEAELGAPGRSDAVRSDGDTP